jgi:hypothetical protein
VRRGKLGRRNVRQKQRARRQGGGVWVQFDDEDCAKASASGKPESYSRPTCSYEYEWVKEAVLWFAEKILQLTAAEDERQVRFLRLCASSHHIGFLIGVVAMLYVVRIPFPSCLRPPAPSPCKVLQREEARALANMQVSGFWLVLPLLVALVAHFFALSGLSDRVLPVTLLFFFIALAAQTFVIWMTF